MKAIVEQIANELEESESEVWSKHEAADFVRTFEFDTEGLERRVAGALKSAIDAHGSITKERVGSAAKRVVNLLVKGD